MAGLTTNDVGDCCCEGGCLPCSPCQIPRKDLRIRVTKPDETPPSYTATLVYNPTGPIWVTSPVAPWGLNPSLSCSAGTIALSGIYPNVGLADFTCNPFHFHYRGPIQPVDYYIDDPGPTTPCPCTNAITVVGCNGLGLPGATVVVQDGGGATVFTGTTNASGAVFPNIGVSLCSITVSKSRFDTHTFTGKTLPCGGSLFLDMQPFVSAGFNCFALGNCPDPWKNTLNYTDSYFGNCTVAWNGSEYLGTMSFSYGGCPTAPFPCPPKGVTINAVVSPIADPGSYWNVNPASLCPDDLGSPGGGDGDPSQTSVVSCPPAASIVTTIPATSTLVIGDTRLEMFCDAMSPPITITVTE